MAGKNGEICRANGDIVVLRFRGCGADRGGCDWRRLVLARGCRVGSAESIPVRPRVWGVGVVVWVSWR